LLVILLCFGASTDGKLYSAWSNGETNSPLTITEVNPETGDQGRILYKDPRYTQLFPQTAAVDSERKRFYLPLVLAPQGHDVNAQAMIEDQQPDIQMAIRGFQLTSDGNVSLISTVAIPFIIVFVCQYDSVLQRVLLFGLMGDLSKPQGFVIYGYVDTLTNTYHNISIPNVVPFSFGLPGGEPAALDAKDRVMVLSTVGHDSNNNPQRYTSLLNLDMNTFKNIPTVDRAAMTLTYSKARGKVYGLFNHDGLSNISFAIVDQFTGARNFINTWSTPFAGCVGSVSVIDDSKDVMYALLNNESLIVFIATIDLSDGSLVRYTNIGHDYGFQAQVLFVL